MNKRQFEQFIFLSAIAATLCLMRVHPYSPGYTSSRIHSGQLAAFR